MTVLLAAVLCLALGYLLGARAERRRQRQTERVITGEIDWSWDHPREGWERVLGPRQEQP